MPTSDDREPPAFEESPIAGGSDCRLDPRWINAERVSGGVLASIVGVASLIAVLVLMLKGPFDGPGVLVWPVAWFVLNGSLTTLLLWWPSLSYRFISYRVSDRGIRICRGVVFRTVSTVPRSRVQHTDVSQGPIERLFELSTLVIYTAGTEYASVQLAGLARETALSIRDQFIDVGEDDAV